MRKYATYLTLLLIFMIPWEGAFRISSLGNLAKLVGVGVGAFWLFTVFLTKQLRKPSLFHLLFFIFVCWNALSIFWTIDPIKTLGQVWTWVQMFILSLVIWDLFDSRSKILAALEMFVLGCFVAIGSAISNYYSGNAYYTHYQRFSAGDTHPDGFGFILAIAVPVAWYLASSIKNNNVLWSVLFKFLNYAYLPAAFIGIILSGTRTALIASIPGMAFGFASLSRIRFWARSVIFLILLISIFMILPYVQNLRSFERFGTIQSELSEGDLNNRTNNWQEGLTIFADHPVLGVGSSMYRTVNSLGKVAHSSYVSVLVETGLVGFGLFSFIILYTLYKAIQQPRWETVFWLTLIFVWAIGASTLTWEDRKTTWIIFGLAVTSAGLPQQSIELGKNLIRHYRPIPFQKQTRTLTP